MNSAFALDQIFAAALRGEAVKWPDEWRKTKPLEQVWRRLRYHGVSGLLVDRQDSLLGWPDELIEDIRQQARAQAFWELRHMFLISELLEELTKNGVASVVLKGTAIAYTLYDTPSARARGDTDLLIARSNLEQASALLTRLGWECLTNTNGIFGELQSQDLWQFRDTAGFTHHLDLHWELTNSAALTEIFNAEEILCQAVAMPRLSTNAQAPTKPDLMIHICVNRMRHGTTGYYSVDRQEFDPDRLIWAYDIALLCSSFSSADWVNFIKAVSKAGIAKICLDAIDSSERLLCNKIPQNVRNCLADLPQETSAVRYLETRGGAGRAIGELKATRGVWNKLSVLMARTFPDPSMLRMKYPKHAGWPILALYLKRVIDAFVAPSGKNRPE